MTLFLQNFLAFPVVIYSGLLVLVAVYWFVACLGLLDLDVLDGDVGADGVDGLAEGLDGGLEGAVDGMDGSLDVSVDGADMDMDLDVGADGADGMDGASDGSSTADGLAGILLRLGIHGVPVTVSLTFITLFGWLMSYFAVHYGLRHMESGPARYGVGLALFFAVFFAASMATSVIIKPLRPLFRRHSAPRAKGLRGKTVTVRSATVTSERGEAILEDGGAGLILQVRTPNQKTTLSRGQRARIQHYDEVHHVYTVIAEENA